LDTPRSLGKAPKTGEQMENGYMRLSTRPVGTLLAAAAMTSLGIAGLAHAGSTPENAVIVIDPAFADSLHIANEYIRLRNIPESNILYMDSAAAANYQGWAAVQQPAFLGFLDQRQIPDHADIVIVSPTDTFWVSEGGLVSDSCFDLQRFSLGTLYTMANISDEILTGPTTQAKSNRYYATGDAAAAFDSEVLYLNGVESTNVNARKYYLGVSLGWTGVRGNTAAQILSSISASVAADGTRPSGTFYLMNNTADSARNVRASGYTSARNGIINRGGLCEVIVGELPNGKTDCLGIMTGVASFSIAGKGITILPGAFTDHLTSYAAAYDINSQTKTSEWISFNAGSSSGAIEEPCNYTGKFPRAMMHTHYFQGVTVAEAWFRNLQYVPFQQYFVGDPLARTFAHIPQVNVADAPTGQVSGTVTLTPTATTTHPTGTIAGFDLLVNGVVVQSITPGGQFSLDTMTLPDGVNDVRVLAWDNTPVKSGGRWTQAMTVNNLGRATNLTPVTTSGTLATRFDLVAAGLGGDVKEIRLLHNGRVVSAAQTANATLSVHGQILGAGTNTVRAETEYFSGRVSRSAPVQITVAASGTPVNTPPVASSYRKRMPATQSYVVELPATYDSSLTGAGYTYTILQAPTMATVEGNYGGAYRIIKPTVGASGQEEMTFRVTTPGGQSNVATVTLIYSSCPADLDASGFVDLDDFSYFVELFEAGDPAADYDQTGFVDTDDYDAFVQAFESGCG
jgi:hypothetical protein